MSERYSIRIAVVPFIAAAWAYLNPDYRILPSHLIKERLNTPQFLPCLKWYQHK